MSDEQEMIYQIQYRRDYDDRWRHYYSDVAREDALEMFALHVSMHGEEQCRLARVAVTKELYSYIPVDQKKDDEDE